MKLAAVWRKIVEVKIVDPCTFAGPLKGIPAGGLYRVIPGKRRQERRLSGATLSPVD
jgi:hypothetical protein